MRSRLYIVECLFLLLFAASCSTKEKDSSPGSYEDNPFIQDYSVRYNMADENTKLFKVVADRNGYIQILSSNGLLRPRAGEFLFPGALVEDTQYRPSSDKNIQGIGLYKDQLIYTDENAVFSNAWAGRIYFKHNLPGAKIIEGGKDFQFLVSDGKMIELLSDSGILWEEKYPHDIIDVKYDVKNDCFWILSKETISILSPGKKTIEEVFSGDGFSSIELVADKLIIGSSNGYIVISRSGKEQISARDERVPCAEITSVKVIKGSVWFGSTSGAFMLRDDGKYNYYSSERWLPSDHVVDIAEGPDKSVLVLTDKGLGMIGFKKMTLLDKAMFFEKQVRERHIRNGFNATVSGMINGDITSGRLEDSDNDGLWTSMYLAGQTFRYAVTKSEDALQNIEESLDAMERLYTINPVPGFPSRSFERRGYKFDDEKWRRADDPEWDWKSTTSSDEAIGHIFAFGVIAELIDKPELKNRAIMLIDTLMSHVLKNNFYLVDWNGEPTLWGKWNPEYVNARPIMVGDRKLNSSNIIGMLQTAYHFTGKEKYREAAFYLINEHGYLVNLTRPLKEISRAPADADEWSRMLSDGWNHSDDEMYFCGYWGLYRYAFNDTLKAKYREAIIDHWEYERPEKDGLWNIMTAITDAEEFDLDEAIWYLKEYPLDLINWTVRNSDRKDIELLVPGFRRQTTKEVLPPDELRIARHNANRFDLDGNGAGKSEYSAGDIWLLPYWMGRYLEVIGVPEK